MPSAIASLDLPDSQQAAISLRATRGHTAKRDTNGKLMHNICTYKCVKAAKCKFQTLRRDRNLDLWTCLVLTLRWQKGQNVIMVVSMHDYGY